MNELGELRPSQLIFTFGVGALVDLPNTSALILGLDDWDIRYCPEIPEERLLGAIQRRLGPQVKKLLLPPQSFDDDTRDPTAPGRFPVRRLDQVLYDLISTAQRRIVLVTFAAHRVPHLCTHLTRAVQRGVELTLIVESEAESEGQLTRDAIAAFSTVPSSGTRLYYWPLAQRDRNQAGRPGKLHVKCAIIDDVALIGSANLTDDAFNRNMELGLLVREEPTVSALTHHFDELILRGVLVEVEASAT